MKSRLNFTLAIMAALFVSFAVVGGIRRYSPVPYWDEWDGYLGFFLAASDGNVSAWWAQHNEHRIVLPRVLSWIDLYFLRGSAAFLYIVNYVLAGLIFACFYSILKSSLTGEDRGAVRLSLSLVILSITFSWLQIDNFTWAFAAQILLAQLLPFFAFYALHLSCVSKVKSRFWFFVSFASAVAAAGSMANGVMALPLLTAFALALRVSRNRCTLLVALTIVTLALYFHGFKTVPGHGSVGENLLHNPTGVLQFALLYLGGPFYYIFRRSELAGQIAGAFMVATLAYFLFRVVRERDRSSSTAQVLIVFSMYACASALGVAAGRLNFGMEAAVSSRYMTLVLMTWSTALILFSPALANAFAAKPRTATALLLIPFALFPEQLKALNFSQVPFERAVAAVALQLGIRDAPQIHHVYPELDIVLATARKIADRQLSVFADPKFRDLNQEIGHKTTRASQTRCSGALDETSAIAGEPRYVRAQGWLYDPSTQEVPETIYLVDENQMVVGYALTGARRRDLENSAGKAALYSGFKGYLLSGFLERPITLVGRNPDCQLATR